MKLDDEAEVKDMKVGTPSCFADVNRNPRDQISILRDQISILVEANLSTLLTFADGNLHSGTRDQVSILVEANLSTYLPLSN